MRPQLPAALKEFRLLALGYIHQRGFVATKGQLMVAHIHAPKQASFPQSIAW
jgi:hypothetical protein